MEMILLSPVSWPAGSSSLMAVPLSMPEESGAAGSYWALTPASLLSWESGQDTLVHQVLLSGMHRAVL